MLKRFDWYFCYIYMYVETIDEVLFLYLCAKLCSETSSRNNGNLCSKISIEWKIDIYIIRKLNILIASSQRSVTYANNLCRKKFLIFFLIYHERSKTQCYSLVHFITCKTCAAGVFFIFYKIIQRLMFCNPLNMLKTFRIDGVALFSWSQSDVFAIV